MREGSNAPYFFVGDHLGSTSLTLNQNGTVYSEMRYKPFGETAWSSLTETPTQRRYTGQIQDFDDTNMQLYFYNARYYDPELARFTQADTIVPEPGNPQSHLKQVALSMATTFGKEKKRVAPPHRAIESQLSPTKALHPTDFAAP